MYSYLAVEKLGLRWWGRKGGDVAVFPTLTKVNKSEKWTYVIMNMKFLFEQMKIRLHILLSEKKDLLTTVSYKALSWQINVHFSELRQNVATHNV